MEREFRQESGKEGDKRFDGILKVLKEGCKDRSYVVRIMGGIGVEGSCFRRRCLPSRGYGTSLGSFIRIQI